MTKQQLSSKFSPLIEKKPIKALGIISKVALGGVLLFLIVGLALMNSLTKKFNFFICSIAVTGYPSTTTYSSFNIGWLCFIMLMIFFLTAIPYYLIHLLTFKRMIMTPVLLGLCVLTFGMILGCLFARISGDASGIYIIKVDPTTFADKRTPSALGIISLLIAIGTFVTTFIPVMKSRKQINGSAVSDKPVVNNNPL